MSSRSFSQLILLALVVWVVDLAASTPWLIVLGACAPAVFYALAIALMQRGSGRRTAELVLAFLWGAVGASFISTALNIAARQWIADVAGGDHARALTATLVAPGIEEAAKALGLLLVLLIRPAAIRSVRDGIVFGALIGVGFVCTENVLYLSYAILQGGEAGLVRAVYIRGLLFGGTHAVFTACVGAGIGWARAGSVEASTGIDRKRVGGAAVQRGVVVPALAFVVAATQHLAWNTAASELINRVLCGADVIGGTCRDVPSAGALFGWAPLWVGAFLAPGCAALWIAANARRAQY